MLKSKGQKEILKRRKFLLTADSPEENTCSGGGANGSQIGDDRRDYEDEDIMHDPNIDESVPYFWIFIKLKINLFFNSYNKFLVIFSFNLINFKNN